MKTKVFALFAVLVMFAGVFTSCDKNDYEPMALQTPSIEEPSIRAESSTRWIGWASVDNYIKEDYYRAYQEASQDFNSWGIEWRFVPVGFYAAYNATHGTSLSYGSNKNLLELCNDHSSGSQFGHGGIAYQNNPQGFADFKRDILNCIHNKGVPVVIYAKLNNPWSGSNGRFKNILTVWSASGSHVGVTKVSDIPGQTFSLYITLEWDDLFNKAINASEANPRVANVAFMTSDTL